MPSPQSLEAVETQYYTIPKPVPLECGEPFGPVTIAYETYGRLNAEKSNAVLIVHALSGDAHAAGISREDGKPGWWDSAIGAGKAFDTDRYFVICSNVLGGCKGTTGPASIDPETGSPYALSFPLITINDMVTCQRMLVDHLGIGKLLCVAGGSMGGMQVVSWMTQYPNRLRSAIPIATALRHSPQQIAFQEVGRQAIIIDPNWRSGNYYGHAIPVKGLAIARMIGHITYMSDTSMTAKFGRERRQWDASVKFAPAFEVEGYLQYRGDSFIKRFDANSYLYITKAMDNFDACAAGDGSRTTRSLGEIFKGLQAKVLAIAFKSDWLYPAYQTKEIVKACKMANIPATYCEIDSTYGHDAFLLEVEQENHLISHFLRNV